MSHGFQREMGEEEVRRRLVLASDNPVYALACRAAGHQGLVVDRLSWELKRRLPALIAGIAAELDPGEDP